MEEGFDYQRKADGRTPVSVSLCAPVRLNEVKSIPARLPIKKLLFMRSFFIGL